ncbi:PstS family phosphate ABC transporter substrate-binding protein [Actinotalea sp. K2]|uniref:PstS family phosphate ABC transporter substrate-binding protein n=1 Tax=Actinotalea sp. K2 TaxID=2939438 RepID=UPI002017287F|nr:PstS family phosphate ABC transporter substrate-binding protein [Actinotalea sp. K2]MCL3861479.1 PstS family phosphate ABC transporter substrate-binding protein [Actinotalea sp. K2]
MSVRPTTLARASVLAIAALALAACGGGETADSPNDAATGADTAADEGNDGLSGQIAIDGSSTVTPLVEPAAELFMNENSGVRVSVATSGTGGGFEKFCNGEIDIAMASRPIKDEEIEACADAGIEYDEVNVANDGLAVVVNPENDWATCLSVDELSAAWTRDSAVSTWSEINAEFPDEELEFYGPGSDSGTFDFFTEEVNGEGGVIRTDYNNIGEDDNAAIIGVSGTLGAMAFIPLSYVVEAGDQVKTVEIENEAGECVAPTEETVMAGDYNPLGRQLYVYPSAEALTRPETVAFLEFFIDNGDEIAEAATMIPLTQEQKDESLAKVAELAGR